MLQNKFKKIDTWMILAGLIYVLLPILIFLLKFTRPYFFAIGLLLFLFLVFKSLQLVDESNGFSNSDILNKKSIIFLIATFVIFCIWIYFSGIGSFSFQNWDFWVRNPIYNDLISKPWPLYYNLGEQNEYVRSLIGGEWVAFAYYFTFWLTPASICKVMNLSGISCQVVLYLHSLIGVGIINYLLCRLYKTFSFKITAILMTFSGLDVIAYIIHNLNLPALTDELEWSLEYYQLSGNTTQIYYVFNQSIPIWIIMLLILNINSARLMAAIGSLCFAYSPWATIGLVPIIIVGIFTDSHISLNDKSTETGKASVIVCTVKNLITICNIFVPLFMLLIFGLYYSASGGSEGGKGLYYFTTNATVSEYIIGFILFVLTEFGLYYITMGRKVLNYRYSSIIFIELLAFPLFYIVDFNFFIRGTIPALFLFMVIIISFLLDTVPDSMKAISLKKTYPNNTQVQNDNIVLRKRILTVLLVIGAMTSVIAFTRSAIKTAEGGEILQSDISTFDDLSTANEYQVLTTNSQFFVHGFATKPFYLFISKIGL